MHVGQTKSIVDANNAPASSSSSVPDSEHNDAATAKEREDFSELCREIYSLLSLPRRASEKQTIDKEKRNSETGDSDLDSNRDIAASTVAPNKLLLFNATILSKVIGKPTIRRRISDILSFLEALEVVRF
jgi:hypothetical protein